MQLLQPEIFDVHPNGWSCTVHGSDVQVRGWQVEPGPQVTSHAQARPQLTLRHEPGPLQSTVHAPVPQVTLRQLCEPLHVTSQALPAAQLTPLRHELAVEHATLQLQPAGQLICWLQVAGLTAQSTTQVFEPVSHDVHCAGHCPPSLTRASGTPPESTATQNPSLHTLPVAQSACAVHAKSPLRWLIEQAPRPAATAAIVRMARAMSFTLGLRT